MKSASEDAHNWQTYIVGFCLFVIIILFLEIHLISVSSGIIFSATVLIVWSANKIAAPFERKDAWRKQY
jgi:hypothetical protein